MGCAPVAVFLSTPSGWRATATSFSDGNRAENEAIKDKFNEKLGVSKAQEQAMLAGSMIRWDSIAAKPKSYDENGKAIKPKDYER